MWMLYTMHGISPTFFLLIGFVGSFTTKMVSFKTFWEFNSVYLFLSSFPSNPHIFFLLLFFIFIVSFIFHQLLYAYVYISIYLYVYTHVYFCPVSIMLIVSMFSGLTICQASHKKFCESIFFVSSVCKSGGFLTSTPSWHGWFLEQASALLFTHPVHSPGTVQGAEDEAKNKRCCV